MPMSKQSEYAADLGEGLGMPLYTPLPFDKDLSRYRVGDIAFFDAAGVYQLYVNAWDAMVKIDYNLLSVGVPPGGCKDNQIYRGPGY
jgi:hypothetical protein